MRLTGKNFQPWADFSMDIEGLTVLVGPSNQGKSSLFRALKGILRNEIPEDFVRNSQDDPLEIELDIDSHHIKATRKRKGTTKYVVDGKIYSSLGGKIPDELAKLNFGEIKIGDYTVDPIFSLQNKSQFLIDSDRWKPNELNAILGAFSSTEKLDAGKKEANTRITQRKSEASALATEIRSAEERSAALVEITSASEIIAEEVSRLETAIRTTETMVGQMSLASHHRSRLEPLQVIVSALKLPDLTKATVLAQQVENTKVACVALTSATLLREMETCMDETADTWASIVTLFKQGKALTDVLEQMSKPTDINPKEFAIKLEKLTNSVNGKLSEAKIHNSSIAVIVDILNAKQAYQAITSQIEVVDVQLEQAVTELEFIREEAAAEQAVKLAAEKAANSVEMCPKCGKSMVHICQ